MTTEEDELSPIRYYEHCFSHGETVLAADGTPVDDRLTAMRRQAIMDEEIGFKPND